ncbi:hypothetical protein MRX96_030449 [Rhipicephalus microplus]
MHRHRPQRTLTDILPPVLLAISPPGTGLPLFEALLAGHHHEAVTARWPHEPSYILRTAPWPGDYASYVNYNFTLLGDPPLEGSGVVSRTLLFGLPPDRDSTALHGQRVTDPLPHLPHARNLSLR